MLPLAIYALGVFSACLISIRVIRRKGAALLIVAICTIIAPALMQGINTLLVGYLDPFWEWTTFWLALIALAASVTALGIARHLDRRIRIRAPCRLDVLDKFARFGFEMLRRAEACRIENDD